MVKKYGMEFGLNPHTSDSAMYVVEIDEALCKGCLLCCTFCSDKSVGVLDKSRETTDLGGYIPKLVGECIGCRWCEIICPDFAISVRREDKC